jgi:diguanylate cyclase
MTNNPDNKKESKHPQDSLRKLAVNWQARVNEMEAIFLNRERLISEREKSISTREASVMRRETAVDLHENRAGMREDAVFLREGSVSSREEEVFIDTASKIANNRHIQMLQQANANLVKVSIEAQEMAEQVKITKDQLAYLAHHDVLTDLPNRALLLDRLNFAIELASRKGWQLALMFLDLDRFKHVNDSLGHTIGDQLLKLVSERLIGCARHSDTVSRQGGDEFVVLLPVIECPEDAAMCAQKLIASLSLPYQVNDHYLHIRVSIGISVYPKDGTDAETLIKNADTAMYCAKESKQIKYKFFKSEMNVKAVQRHTIEAGLRHALDFQEFVLHYQPKIALSTGLIVGVEALIRWQHPVLGEKLPTEFVPIAEDCGLILPIGRWVLREACLQAQAWRQMGMPQITVSVNTSALEFNDMGFFEYIRTTLEETGLEPCYLELELTESVLMEDAEFTCSVLNKLADLGVKLAIDDFGIGYSSLNYLKQFPITTLKIDQSFVQNMINNPDDASIVRAVISLGKSLKLAVIAEGVETKEQHAFLVAQDCDEVQGYLFGYPMLAASLTDFLKNNQLQYVSEDLM